MGWAYKLSPEAQKLDLEIVLKTLAKHRMDFTAAARELKVKTIDLYRFASRNPRVLDDLFGAELDRVSKSVTWFDQALSGEHGINVALDVSKFVLKNSPAARQVGWGAPVILWHGGLADLSGGQAIYRFCGAECSPELFRGEKFWRRDVIRWLHHPLTAAVRGLVWRSARGRAVGRPDLARGARAQEIRQ